MKHSIPFTILLLCLCPLLLCGGGCGSRSSDGNESAQPPESGTEADTPADGSETENENETETEAQTKEPETMCVRVSADPGEDPFDVTPAAAPDPFITFDNDTGYYYALCTQNSYIELHRSRTVANIYMEGESKIIYTCGQEVSDSIWAPEMVKLDGKWYIYTSASVPDTDGYKHLFVLESETGNPFDGFHFKAFLNNKLFAIDPTVWEDKTTGTRYICVSEVVSGVQWLSIGVLENPWTLAGRLCRISKPTDYRWESMGGVPLNEGPFFVSSGERLFIIYSANGCYNDTYRLGCLELTGDNMLEKKSWTKSDTWLFAAEGDIYAPGHASFFYSPDGSELWIAYHCYDSSNSGDRRRMRVCQVQKVGFDETGYPVLGSPLPKDTTVNVPSGE